MAGSLSAEVDKRIKALRKKLTQIDKLKTKGGQYTEEEEAKIASEKKILADISALEKGEEPQAEVKAPVLAPEPEKKEAAEEKSEPQAEAAAAEAVEEPLGDVSPAEAEKRIRALKKKLVQIDKLVERGGTTTEEEAAKIASQPSIAADVLKLELHLLEGEPKKAAMTLAKKLDQVAKLRLRGGQLNTQEREKVMTEPKMKKELDAILAARVPVKEDKPVVKEEKTVKKEEKVAKKEEKPAKKDVVPNGSPYREPASALPPAVLQQQYAYEAEEASAIAQGFAVQDDFEEEGFVEIKKKKGKKAAAAEEEPVIPEEEAPAAEEEDEQEWVEVGKNVGKQQEVVASEWDAPAPSSGTNWADVADQDPQSWDAPSPKEAEPVKPMPVKKAAASPAAPAQAKKEQAQAPPAKVVVEQKPADNAEKEDSGPQSIEKRIKALKKKLGQIDKLRARGGDFTKEELEKLESEARIKQEVAALEKGEPWPPAGQEVEAVKEEEAPEAAPEAPKAAPVVEKEEDFDCSPEEASKKIKAIKKKLGQIDKIKEKSSLNADETQKVATEPKLLADIAKLEKLLK